MKRPSAWPARSNAVISNAQATTDITGVKKPRHRSVLTAASARHIKGKTEDLRTSKQLSSTAPARETRSINNAMPGAPVGNIEKRRNTSQLIRNRTRDQSAKGGSGDPSLGGYAENPRAGVTAVPAVQPSINPRFIAMVTACVRSLAPSFDRILFI
jgi:hypothetical protein